MRDLLAPAQKRIRLFYLLLIGVFVIFLIRLGFIQFIYQNDIVTFAQMDQTVQELNASIIEEVKNSFEVDLENYSEVDVNDIINNGRKDISALSLLDLMSTSCQEGCIGQPTAYLQGDNGFLFFKKKNDENVLLELNKENDRWEVKKTQMSDD